MEAAAVILIRRLLLAAVPGVEAAAAVGASGDTRHVGWGDEEVSRFDVSTSDITGASARPGTDDASGSEVEEAAFWRLVRMKMSEKRKTPQQIRILLPSSSAIPSVLTPTQFSQQSATQPRAT